MHIHFEDCSDMFNPALICRLDQRLSLTSLRTWLGFSMGRVHLRAELSQPCPSPEWDQSRPLLQAGCDISTTPSPLQTSLHCICETHICAADQTETCSQKSLCSALSTFDLKSSFSPCLYFPLCFTVSSCSFQVIQWRVARHAASQWKHLTNYIMGDYYVKIS